MGARQNTLLKFLDQDQLHPKQFKTTTMTTTIEEGNKEAITNDITKYWYKKILRFWQDRENYHWWTTSLCLGEKQHTARKHR